MLRPLFGRYSAMRLSTLMILVGAVLMAPFARGAARAARTSPTSARCDWGALAYSTIFPLVVTNVLYFAALRRVGAARATLFMYLQPFLGALFAALLLGEEIGAIQIVGGVFIVGGVALGRTARVRRGASRARARRARAARRAVLSGRESGTVPVSAGTVPFSGGAAIRRMLMAVAAPAVITIPDRRLLARLYAAERQQMDNLCGCFWASLALRAAGIDADQEAVALEAGAILPGGDPLTHVAPGATPRNDYRVELPHGRRSGHGRHGRAAAGRGDRPHLGRLARGDRGGGAVVRRDASPRCSTSPVRRRVLIANLRTGLFWGSRPDPGVVLDHLSGGDPEPPPADWDVGHFVELATLVRGPGGSLVVVRDTYQELGLAGAPRAAARARRRRAPARRRQRGRRPRRVRRPQPRTACATGSAAPGFELRGWDNGTPAAPRPS